MEDNLDNQYRESGMVISARAQHFLLYTAKWANFLAIIGIVFMSIAAIGAIFMLVSAAMIPGMGIMALTYIIMIGIYIFPLIYMFNFSKNMKMALLNQDSMTAERSFEYMKSLFKFMGIFTIVIISLYILAILFGVGAAAMFR